MVIAEVDLLVPVAFMPNLESAVRTHMLSGGGYVLPDSTLRAMDVIKIRTVPCHTIDYLRVRVRANFG